MSTSLQEYDSFRMYNKNKIVIGLVRPNSNLKKKQFPSLSQKKMKKLLKVNFM